MISHRPASLACCDRVIVMRGGAIAAAGRYDELRGREVELDELPTE